VWSHNLLNALGILITDLDSFEAEDELTDEISNVEINKPFLEHMKRPLSPLIPPERANQALVLYRPIPNPLEGSEQKDVTNIESIERMEVETRDNQHEAKQQFYMSVNL